MEFLHNFPFWAALTAIFFAQFIKVPLHFIMTKKADWTLITSTGGMPSSHSAGVTALTTSVALDAGLGSTLFAVSAIFAIIVMFDATGVRRQAGEQAAVLNRLSVDFQKMISDIHVWQGKTHKEKQMEFIKLKELLGHKPVEVFFGGLTGIVWALALHKLLGVF
ncbi:divergent PAP2 family protein [Bacillus sp. FJAT-49711]|uniref:divergent PAP2 family protein n=1 Tax=Bacillus sp. FJAT-49711 TaxID=2833585 RepID=UPI001BC92CF4|nr:divergent PAP2 family protein [Bacillus sp. FJAT-49711]MBS4220866.1 divergent PAP2 family protein [Bacillus sp. FJAT-49711]